MVKIGVVGYAEGGLLAFYAVALDLRLEQLASGDGLDFYFAWRGLLERALVGAVVMRHVGGGAAHVESDDAGESRFGGGRSHADDAIDPSVGLTDVIDIGTQVRTGSPLCQVHAASEADADAEGLLRCRTFNGSVTVGLVRAPANARILALTLTYGAYVAEVYRDKPGGSPADPSNKAARCFK